MSDGTHLRGLTPEQHSSEETSHWPRAAGDFVFDLTGPEIESEISRAKRDILDQPTG